MRHGGERVGGRQCGGNGGVRSGVARAGEGAEREGRWDRRGTFGVGTGEGTNTTVVLNEWRRCDGREGSPDTRSGAFLRREQSFVLPHVL